MLVRRDDRKGQAIALLAGAVLGGALGEIFRRYVPVIGEGVIVGFKPFTIDLYISSITLGATFKITIAAIIGLLLAFLLIIKK